MKNIRRNLIFYILLIFTSLICFLPVIYALSVSFMDTKDISAGKMFTLAPTIKNYIEVVQTIPILHYMLNSFVTSAIVMVARLITCSLAAYAFVFIRFKGSKTIFMLFISTMMVPWESTLIPNYALILKMGLLNTYPGLTLPFMASAFGIFLIRQHFLTIPGELNESAQIDGCGRFRFFISIALPLSKPVLASWAVYSFLNTWNMYLWPLLVSTTNQSRTIQIGLRTLVSQEAGTDWGMLMAGVIYVIVPSMILLLAGQKQLKSGLTAGAVKG